MTSHSNPETPSMEHECEGIPSPDFFIGFDSELLGSEKSWRLSVERSATETDLEENQYLEQVGDTMWRVSVGISHCPFCGIALDTLSGEAQSAVGEKYLYDHKSWYMSKR